MSRATMTRRGFLKSTAAMGAVTALGISAADSLTAVDPAHADEASDVKIIKTSCRACIASCAVLAHVRDGRVVKIEGNPESPMSQGGVCAKGLAGIQALYHPNRNKYPMRRVGERGTNQWERISWEEALTEVATKINEVSDKYGSEAISVSTGGGGNPHFSNVKRFGEAINTPNVWEPGCSQCYLPRMGASLLAYGAGKPNNLSFSDSNGWDYYSTDSPVTSLVLWGTDPSNSSVATGGRALAELRNRPEGLRTVVIDPRYTLDAAKAEVWLPIRPGTDAALLLTWTRWILENEKYDADFCRTWTNMPYLINPETRLTLKATEAGLPGTDADYVVWDPEKNAPVVVEFPMNEGLSPALFGTYEVNGMQCATGGQLLKESCEEWTLEKGAEVCWLDPEQIERALEIYTDPNGQSGIMQGVCIDQYVQSQQCALGALNLEFLMGNVEKPGTMLQKFAPAPCKDQLGNTPRLLSKEKVMKRCGTIEHKGILCWDMARIPSVFKAMKDGDPYQIHMWIERSGNKHVVLGNSSCLDEIVPNLDYIVQCFMYPTAFSVLCADLLLPTTEWLETNLTIPQLNTIVMRQAVTHLFETVEEGIIWTQIVQKCAELGNTHCPKAFDEAACMTTPFYKNEYEKQLQHLNKLDMTWDEGRHRVGHARGVPHLPDLPRRRRGESRQAQGLRHAVEEAGSVLRVQHHLGPHRCPVVPVRRGGAARPAAGQRRLRASVLLRGAGRVAPDRHRVPARAHRGPTAHVPPRHPAQHSLSARDLPGAGDVDPSRGRREIRHRRRPVGEHREPPRQDPRQGPRHHRHRQGRRVPGALLGSRAAGFRRPGPGLQGDEHQRAHQERPALQPRVRHLHPARFPGEGKSERRRDPEERVDRT